MGRVMLTRRTAAVDAAVTAALTASPLVLGGGTHGTPTTSATLVGHNAQADVNYGTATGHTARVIGWGGTATGASTLAGLAAYAGGAFVNAADFSIGLGYEFSVDTGVMGVGFGPNATPISRCVFGHGSPTTPTPAALRVGNSDASGANVAGAPLQLSASCGTGNQAGGATSLASSPAGASGSALNAAVDGVKVAEGNKIGFLNATPVVKQTATDTAEVIAALQAYGLLT